LNYFSSIPNIVLIIAD